MPAAEYAIAQLSDLVPICNRLPSASVDQLIGATRVISRAGGRTSQRMLAKALHFDDEHAVGVTEFLARLGLVEPIGGEIALTADGERMASAGISKRRRLFADLAVRLPIIRQVMDVLAEQPSRSLPRSQLLEGLGARSCASDAEHVFDHVVSWGRFAGLFSYDASSEVVSLL